MSLHKDIPELVRAGILSPETADKIHNYYKNKENESHNRLFIVFGILGALLIGLGIILILAHNWDEFPRAVKTGFAFLPLVIGQALCAYILLKKSAAVAWRESGAVFLFFAVGASISLVAQIYNIPGNLSSFLLTWMLLGLPLVYSMKSSATSLLYLIGLSYYAVEIGYWTYPSSKSYLYWWLLLLLFPHYYLLYKKNPQSNFMLFHNWMVPLSVLIALGTVADKTEELMFVAYMSLLGCYYLIGNSTHFKTQKRRNNGYLLLGSFGTIALLLGLSFDGFWEKLSTKHFLFNELITTTEFRFALLFSLLALVLLYLQKRKKQWNTIHPQELIFLIFILIFILGLYSSISVILINFLVFGIGIFTLRKGAKINHLGILNYGLGIITALVICRFFDTNLPFVIRGILFVSVGIGFFAANYWMLKKRKKNE